MLAALLAVISYAPAFDGAALCIGRRRRGAQGPRRRGAVCAVVGEGGGDGLIFIRYGRSILDVFLPLNTKRYASQAIRRGPYMSN